MQNVIKLLLTAGLHRNLQSWHAGVHAVYVFTFLPTLKREHLVWKVLYSWMYLWQWVLIP